MKLTELKFVSVLALHIFLFFGFLFLSGFIPALRPGVTDIAFAALFSLVYFALVWYDLYSRPYHNYLRKAFYFIFKDLALSAVILLCVEYVFYYLLASRIPSYTLTKGVILIVFFALMQSLQYAWIIHLARLGFFRKNVMLVGTYDDRLPVENLFQNINNTKNFIGQMHMVNGEWYYRADFTANPVKLTKPLSRFLMSRAVNELVMCMDSSMSSAALQECALWCHENSIGYYLIPDISALPRAQPWNGKFSHIPAIERFCPNRDSLIMISLKRLIDIAVSFTALIILAPVMALIALFIKLEDGGPVFYVSERVGIHGKKIRFIKFRSMILNADSLKEQLLKFNERPDGPLFKLTDDPRVTPVGRFLRKTSLDEIPQFFNVLRGDMSLIGPRPHLPSEVLSYSDKDNLRLECIPGISCLPQIYGRDTLGFREWVDLDLKYRKNWSLFYDIKIMFKTARIVLEPFFAKG